MRITRSLAFAAAFLIPSLVLAGPARVDGLVGNPTSSRNGLFLEDELNQFLNPAHAYAYRNRALVSLGLTSGGSFNPLGGVTMGFGPAAIGLYLNRPRGLYTDQDALNTVLTNLMAGGHGGAFALSEGASAPLFLPIDLIASFDLGAAQVGIGVYAAFGRTLTRGEVLVDDDFATTTNTLSSNFVSFSGGGVLPLGSVAPEVWVRGGLSTAWNDTLAQPADSSLDPTFDQLQGIRDTGSIGGGFRLPIDLDPVTITTGLSIRYAQGMPFFLDRLTNPPMEDGVTTVSSISGVLGVGVELSPVEQFRLVGTLSAELDTAVIDTNNDEEGDAFAGGRSSTLRPPAPVLSVGAEANPIDVLWIRGSFARGSPDRSTRSGCRPTTSTATR